MPYISSVRDNGAVGQIVFWLFWTAQAHPGFLFQRTNN